MQEIWKDVKGYENIYQISNLGNVRSLDRIVNCNGGTRLVKGKSLSRCNRGNGYLFVTFGKRGKQHNMDIHRMVASAFIPNPNNYEQVNHKDEIKTNNIATNLEWCTPKYNTNYGTAVERRAAKTSKRVNQIRDGKRVKAWRSLSEIKRTTNYSIGNISSCCNGKRENAHGYQWEYS